MNQHIQDKQPVRALPFLTLGFPIGTLDKGLPLQGDLLPSIQKAFSEITFPTFPDWQVQISKTRDSWALVNESGAVIMNGAISTSKIYPAITGFALCL